jgi:hypothetical protein
MMLGRVSPGARPPVTRVVVAAVATSRSRQEQEEEEEEEARAVDAILII